MTTEEESDEFEQPSGYVEPRRFVFPDALVVLAAFGANIADAVLILWKDVFNVLSAHANYRRKVVDDKKAVEDFHRELEVLPTASK